MSTSRPPPAAADTAPPPPARRITSTSKAFCRQDLEVFNILQHPVWVFDFLRMRMYWANDAAVSMWQAPNLPALLERDFSDTTPATLQRMKEGYEKLKQGQTHSEQWTIYPGGKVKTIDLHWSGIRLVGGNNSDNKKKNDNTEGRDDDEEDERLGALGEAEMPTDGVSDSTTRGLELFRHARAAVSQFDLDDGKPIYRNAHDMQLYGTESLVERFVDPDLGQNLIHQLQVSARDDSKNANDNDKDEDEVSHKTETKEGGGNDDNQSKRDIELEVQHYLEDGSTIRWFSVSCHVGKDPVTGKDAIIYSGRDITDIVQARLETSQAQRKLNFLNILTHELRTPLHQITGYADILDNMTELTDPQRDCVQFIQRSTTSLMAIINDLLDYNQLEEEEEEESERRNRFTGEEEEEEDKDEAPRVHFSLRAFAQACASDMEAKAQGKGLTFSYQELEVFEDDADDQNCSTSSDTLVVGDAHKLRRILTSLSDNAIKFTNQGQVSLTVRAVPTNDDEDCNHNSNDNDDVKNSIKRLKWIAFQVKDTGIGIAPKDQGIIFERYRQVNMMSTRSYDGTGLGLAITKMMCAKMGGKIMVESELGEGSTFIVELPFELPATTAENGENDLKNTPTLQSALKMPGQALRVLIVEDNEVNAKMAKRMIERMGHSTLRAEHGQIALDLLAEYPIDLVLMDIHMPVMDGIEATKQIRQLGKGKQYLPIIGLTASFQRGHLQDYLDIGMNTCLSKPIRLAILQKTFKVVMARCAAGFYSDDGITEANQ